MDCLQGHRMGHRTGLLSLTCILYFLSQYRLEIKKKMHGAVRFFSCFAVKDGFVKRAICKAHEPWKGQDL